jgi:hypothetical protein
MGLSPLLACPFCGDTDPREKEDDNYTWCTNRRCPIYDIEITRKGWNVRAQGYVNHQRLYSIVDACFHAFASDYRLDAAGMVKEILNT